MSQDCDPLYRQRRHARWLLRDAISGEPIARKVIRDHHPQLRDAGDEAFAALKLHHTQLVVARLNGFMRWNEMVAEHEYSDPSLGSERISAREQVLPWILEVLRTAEFRAAPEAILRRHFEDRTYCVPDRRDLIAEIVCETETYSWLLNAHDEQNSASHWEAFLKSRFFPEEDIWDSDFEYLSDSND